MYYNINLEMIRDEVLRTKRSMPCDFKAYLWTIARLGCEITNRDELRSLQLLTGAQQQEQEREKQQE